MDKLAVITIGLLIGLMVVFVPFSLVWAINILLGQNNPYSFWTWLAATVVISLFRIPNAKKDYLKKS
jgi:hypothetical protein